MRWIALTLACLALIGCGGGKTALPQVVDEPKPLQSAETGGATLLDLLAKPRNELAAMANELENKLSAQQRARRERRLTFFSDWHPSIIISGLRRAQYSEKVGFSLPPYTKAGEIDRSLAMHFAEMGDFEAACKLIDANDTATRSQLESLKLEKSYPIEWTRLVSLLAQHGALRLGTGDPEGLSELESLHDQLGKTLDPKARAGSLGAALLPLGHYAVSHSLKAFRAEQKQELANRASEILKRWGAWPIRKPVALPQMPKQQLESSLRCATPALSYVLSDPIRALDLFGWPWPDEGVDGLLLCFDQGGKLLDCMLAYKPGTARLLPKPSDVAEQLVQMGITGKDLEHKGLGEARQSFDWGGQLWEVATIARGAGIGGFARLFTPEGVVAKALPRTLGGFNLDRSFDQNRQLFAPSSRGASLTIERPSALAQIVTPIEDPKPNTAQAFAAPNGVSTRQLALQYNMDVGGTPSLIRLALPLWQAYGPPVIMGVEENLSLLWSDQRTECQLLVPFENSHPVTLRWTALGIGSDSTAPNVDLEERKARLAAGKPLARLPRALAGVKLGMTIEEAKAQLPTGKKIQKEEWPGALMAIFADSQPGVGLASIRQLTARASASGKIVELRGYYIQEGPGQGSDWAGEILNTLTKSAGASKSEPSPWTTVWSGFPPRKTRPTRAVWHDDLTRLSVDRDQGTALVTMIDCPPEEPMGVRLPALSFLPDPPAGMRLGISAKQAESALKGKNDEKAKDGAWIARIEPANGYDYLLLYWENSALKRVVGHHESAISIPSVTIAAECLQAAWVTMLGNAGWPQRRDLSTGGHLQSLSWLDETKRVTLFWRENDKGHFQLFTEWQLLQ